MTKKMEPQFRSAYGDRLAMPFYTKGDSLTQQHFKDECDIDKIIAKHDSTGLISHVARGVAEYGDYSEINEYREALELVDNANQSFMEIPSNIRKMFNNNAGEFFEFATNPDNLDKMIELGLAPSPAPEIEESTSSKKAAPEPADTEKSEG